jgi:hypothetical protein
VVLLVLDGHIGGFDRPFSAAVRGAPPAFATLSSLPCRPVEMGCSGGPPGTQRCAWQGLCGRSVAVRTVRGIPLHTRYSSGRREALKRRELGSRTAGKSAPRLSTLSRCSPPQLTLIRTRPIAIRASSIPPGRHHPAVRAAPRRRLAKPFRRRWHTARSSSCWCCWSWRCGDSAASRDEPTFSGPFRSAPC